MELNHRDCGCLPDIGVLIYETLPEYSVILSTLMQPTVLTARALIRLLGSLQSFKNVMKDVGHVKLGLGIVHHVEDKLLQLQFVCLHAVDHVGEECQHVLPHGHAGDHLIHFFAASQLLSSPFT